MLCYVMYVKKENYIIYILNVNIKNDKCKNTEDDQKLLVTINFFQC